MNADSLSLIAGSVLSLIFSYIPGLSGKFDALSSESKRAVMLALVIIVAAASYTLTCSQLAIDLGWKITCGKAGIVELVRLVILTAIANQGAYSLTKR